MSGLILIKLHTSNETASRSTLLEALKPAGRMTPERIREILPVKTHVEALRRGIRLAEINLMRQGGHEGWLPNVMWGKKSDKNADIRLFMQKKDIGELVMQWTLQEGRLKTLKGKYWDKWAAVGKHFDTPTLIAEGHNNLDGTEVLEIISRVVSACIKLPWRAGCWISSDSKYMVEVELGWLQLGGLKFRWSRLQLEDSKDNHTEIWSELNESYIGKEYSLEQLEKAETELESAGQRLGIDPSAIASAKDRLKSERG